MDYQSMKIEHIIDWCVANKQVDWLKATAAKKTECKVYPRKKVVNAKGKVVSKADKSQPYTIEKRNISFIEIKKAFCEQFMPELLPEAKEKKASMYDIIAAL
jgi:hypothetical protein